MEEISTSYDDATIRKWADDIRQIKIKELKEEVRIHKKIMKTSRNNYYKKTIQDEIDALKEKLNILETK